MTKKAPGLATLALLGALVAAGCGSVSSITYQPLTGQKFTRSLLSPIRPVQLLALVEAGYPVDFLFRIGVRSINVRNRSDIAMRRVQQSGAVGMR
jgi:hypothetical protein